MHNLHTYNLVLLRHIKSYVAVGDWDGLIRFFSKLSNSEFRTACNMMATEVAPQLADDDYWHCFRMLFADNPKAWLVTMLKAGLKKYAAGSFLFQGPVLEGMCHVISQEGRRIDERKLLQHILPVLKTPDEVELLLKYLQLDDEPAARYLIECHTSPCYFALFQRMRRMDNQPELLSLLCAELLRRGGDKAFNFVSMIKNYFDLPAVKGIFSLRINPYELSRLDSSYELFCQMLHRI